LPRYAVIFTVAASSLPAFDVPGLAFSSSSGFAGAAFRSLDVDSVEQPAASAIADPRAATARTLFKKKWVLRGKEDLRER